MSQFCTKCGAPITDNAAFCGKCGNRLDQMAAPTPVPPPIYQANPVSTVPGVQLGPAYIYPKANVGGRIGASLLDGLFAMLGYFAIMVPFWVISFIFISMANPHSHSAMYGLAGIVGSLGVLVGWVLIFAYSLLKDGLVKTPRFGLKPGQGYGKKVCKLMVINVNTNRPCSMGESALRYLTWIVPFLGLVEIIIGLAAEDGRRLGDKLANTQVIDAALYRP
jgi:uncharacterized RDD family membrane protein YckC